MKNINVFLFLDFDGVLHSAEDNGTPTFTQLPLLEEVLREFPDVLIVISSDWRKYFTLGDLKYFFSSDIQQRVVGKSPHRFRKRTITGAEDNREAQARLFIGNYRYRQQWVALDDREDLYTSECPNLLKIDPRTGFTQKDADILRARLQMLTLIMELSSIDLVVC